MCEGRDSGVSADIGTERTFEIGADGTGKREVHGSGVSAESGTKGPFELRTFGTKSSGVRGSAGS
ncbi:hypothetical protein KI387_022449, partial [Taxus chinensis]